MVMKHRRSIMIIKTILSWKFHNKILILLNIAYKSCAMKLKFFIFAIKHKKNKNRLFF